MLELINEKQSSGWMWHLLMAQRIHGMVLTMRSMECGLMRMMREMSVFPILAGELRAALWALQKKCLGVP